MMFADVANSTRLFIVGNCMSYAAPKFFLAERRDGLGERFCAILNAIHLSQRLDCQFSIWWPETKLMSRSEFHTLPKAHEIFAADFLARHFTEDEPDRTRFVTLKPRHATLAYGAYHSELMRDDFDGWICPQRDLRDASDTANQPLETFSYGRAFQRIKFTAAFQTALDLARTVPLNPRTVAVHVRGGDLVFGLAKQFPALLNKAIPAPMGRVIVRNLRAQGLPVLVFGQEPETIALLEKHGAQGVSRISECRFQNRTQQDLFEIVLMSRCGMTYTGESGFSRLAAMIGDKKPFKPLESLRPKEQYKMISRELFWHGRAYKPLAAAAAWKYLYYGLGYALSQKQQEKALERARQLDPENCLYVLSLATHHFCKGKFELGDDLLGGLLKSEYLQAGKMAVTASMRHFANPRRKMFPLDANPPRKMFLLDRDFPAFELAAAAGMPVPSLVVLEFA